MRRSRGPTIRWWRIRSWFPIGSGSSTRPCTWPDLRPVPQYEEAPYTLDFALFHGERKLDIEVDGENYHRNWDGELCRRDQIRSRRLGDLGWDIMRFWVYEIRDDLEGSVRRVKEWTGIELGARILACSRLSPRAG